MSEKSDALEIAVIDLIAARTAHEAAPCARRRAAVDHGFARLAALAAPRIRYFIRRYGLSSVADDAEQACAIALHRAAASYDPRRARFTTHVNWQLRAELQALRHRLYGDQRRIAHRFVAETLSLDAGEIGDSLADPAAEAATESGAADLFAERCADRMTEDWARRRGGTIRRGSARLAAETALVRRQLTATEAPGRLSEAERHVVRRAFADIARHMA
ncbi:RNA polymerase subunit sigma-70 [Sphingopyxis sp. KK2]|uniref:RNA polymerase subunit sigma-70 n=1 Tax=Sphingopyxis sp. KK2 TaxID=1855727 RepID=UPI00097E5907|nr:RNA polymerase subunit sigma-70 [Sphingopyxis sp. KK2]